MKQKILIALTLVVSAVGANAQLTLDRCLELARENYPLIRQYDVLSQTESLDLRDINKGWLPQVGIYAQATAQNVVPAFPEVFKPIMASMGTEMKGLGKVQYKVGLDLQQTIWDGGASKSDREVARASRQVNDRSLEVELYGVNQRVEELFFGILLLEDQRAQVESSIAVLESNLTRMRSMVTNGVAMQADADMLEAQLLASRQQLVQAINSEESYRSMLAIYIGTNEASQSLVKPDAEEPVEMTSNRPELHLFDSQIAANAARRGNITASLMPQISFFASAYYGYPGYDYFKSMMTRDMSFNALAGIKVSWTFGGLYRKSNNEQRLNLADRSIELNRETFLFNNDLQAQSGRDKIKNLREVAAEDSRIVELRRSVRQSAESQLRNGVIDSTSLLARINEETQAKLNESYHQIQLLQSIYQLKHTINR